VAYELHVTQMKIRQLIGLNELIKYKILSVGIDLMIVSCVIPRKRKWAYSQQNVPGRKGSKRAAILRFVTSRQALNVRFTRLLYNVRFRIRVFIRGTPVVTKYGYITTMNNQRFSLHQSSGN